MTRSIIFAEDDSSLRRSYGKYFSGTIEDSLIDLVPSGEALVERVKNGDYDLVVTDYSMGGISGVEAASEIRKFSSNIPIVILSGEASSIEKKAAEAGVNECINKREMPSVIAKKLAHYLP